MEVKINTGLYGKRIFRAVFKAARFFRYCLRGGSGGIFSFKRRAWYGNGVVGMRTLRGSVCGSGLHKVQRHDCGTLFYRVAQKRDNNA